MFFFFPNVERNRGKNYYYIPFSKYISMNVTYLTHTHTFFFILCIYVQNMLNSLFPSLSLSLSQKSCCQKIQIFGFYPGLYTVLWDVCHRRNAPSYNIHTYINRTEKIEENKKRTTNSQSYIYISGTIPYLLLMNEE
jgi:hypothetical protein